jgi:hypothetical protein
MIHPNILCDYVAEDGSVCGEPAPHVVGDHPRCVAHLEDRKKELASEQARRDEQKRNSQKLIDEDIRKNENPDASDYRTMTRPKNPFDVE